MKQKKHFPVGRLTLMAPAILYLSACGGGPDKGNLPDTPTIELDCTITEGGADAAGKCALEWLAQQAGEDRSFLIHHPGGGFRRFMVSADGTNVGAADGAEPLRREEDAEKGLILTVGGDVYRLKAQDLQPPASLTPSSPGADNGAAGTDNAAAIGEAP